MGDFDNSLRIAATGLHAQSDRMRIIAENLANSDSVGKTPGAEPYRRKMPTFEAVYNSSLGAETVQMGPIAYDASPFKERYEPGHPAADASGYVKYPNVDPLVEATDMREAQRTYEANLNVVTATRQMLSRTLDILKG